MFDFSTLGVSGVKQAAEQIAAYEKERCAIPLAQRALSSEHKDSRDFWTDMSELVRLVKRGDQARITRELGTRPEARTPDEFERLCILATYIEYTLSKHKRAAIEWVYAPDLFLKEPFIPPDAPELVLMFCSQPCLNHNVLLPDTAFETLGE